MASSLRKQSNLRKKSLFTVIENLIVIIFVLSTILTTVNDLGIVNLPRQKIFLYNKLKAKKLRTLIVYLTAYEKECLLILRNGRNLCTIICVWKPHDIPISMNPYFLPLKHSHSNCLFLKWKYFALLLLCHILHYAF